MWRYNTILPEYTLQILIMTGGSPSKGIGRTQNEREGDKTSESQNRRTRNFQI